MEKNLKNAPHSFFQRLRLYFRKIWEQIVSEKKNIALTFVWGASLSVIMIKSYQLFYLQNKLFQKWRIPINQYEGPALAFYDLLLFLLISMIIGYFIADIKKLIYSWFSSVIICFFMASLYYMLYIVYVLQPPILAYLPCNWEWVFVWATVNTIRMMFPIGIFLSLLGGFMGTFLSVLL